MQKVEDEEVKKIATSDETLISLLNITEMNLNLFKIIKSQKLDEDVIAEYLYKQEVNLGIHSCITYSFLVRRQSGFGIVFHSKA